MLLLLLTASGFNRYIVECKEHGSVQIVEIKLDLIDTLWNVKLLRRPVLQPAPRWI